MRRCLPLLAVLALAACAGAGPEVPPTVARPVRVMSLSQCTDQLVLALLPPERIASVTWLSRDPAYSPFSRQASRVAVNHGQAEEVLAQRPDLVLASSFGTPEVRGVLRRLGYPLVEVDDAAGFDAVRRSTRQVAAALGEPARGEALLARMEATLAALARRPGPPVPVVAWGRDGLAAGPGTILDAVLAAAGARNLARDQAGADVELLLRLNPALLVQAGDPGRPASLGDDVARHRLVRRFWHDRTVAVPQSAYLCGTPATAEMAARLAVALRAASDRVGPGGPLG